MANTSRRWTWPHARLNAGITLRGMAIFASALARFTDAQQHLAQAMELFAAASAELDMAMALNCLGEVHNEAGDQLAAEQACR